MFSEQGPKGPVLGAPAGSISRRKRIGGPGGDRTPAPRLRSPRAYPRTYGPARKDRQVDFITPGPTGGAGTGAAGRPGDRARRPARRARPLQIRADGSAG